MSEMEFHVGKMIEVDYKSLGYSTIEEYCKSKCKEFNLQLKPYQTSFFEAWVDYNYESKIELIVFKDRLFKLEDKYFDEPYFSNLTKNPDGTFNYAFGFYNGGTCLNEIVKDELYNLYK